MPLRTTSPVPEPQQDAALFAWHEGETEDDIALLQKTACGFHDAVIRRMKLETGCRYVPGEGMYLPYGPEGQLALYVDSDWFGRMQLAFSGVRSIRFQPYTENYFPELQEAIVCFRTDLLGRTRDDRLIVWSDGAFDPTVPERLDLRSVPVSYVIAQALQWRLIEEEQS